MGLWEFIILHSLILCMFQVFHNKKVFKNKWKRRKTILIGLVMVKLCLSVEINLGNRTRGFPEEREGSKMYQMTRSVRPFARFCPRDYLITVLTTNPQGERES